MHTFLIASTSKEAKEKKAQEILSPFAIHPLDISRVSPENTIGIADIRNLKHIVSLKPFRSESKAIIIEDAQTLTIEAQNALLKTLEEPPDHTIIILLANNVQALLPTIVSRCEVIELAATGNWQLAADGREAMSQELEALLTDKVGDRLKLAEDIAKDKMSATLWLENMILAGRKLLLDEVAKNKNNLLISQYLSILVSFQRVHTLLSTTNINPRFALETYLLSLTPINSDTISS